MAPLSSTEPMMLGTALHHTGTPIPPACAACYMLYPDRFHASHLAFFFSPPSLFYPKTSMSPFHPASHGFLLTLLHFVFAPDSGAASFSRPAFWALFSGKSVCWTMSDWAALLMTTGGNQTPTESLLSHFGHFVASENSNSSGLPGFPLQGPHSACRTGYRPQHAAALPAGIALVAFGICFFSTSSSATYFGSGISEAAPQTATPQLSLQRWCCFPVLLQAQGYPGQKEPGEGQVLPGCFLSCREESCTPVQEQMPAELGFQAVPDSTASWLQLQTLCQLPLCWLHTSSDVSHVPVATQLLSFCPLHLAMPAGCADALSMSTKSTSWCTYSRIASSPAA